MADLGPGPHRCGVIAEQLGRTSQSLAPTPARLIAKGMVWSSEHGDTAFIRRTMPNLDS